MSQSPRARQSPLEKAEESVAYWRAELAQVERERRGMVWALRVGVPLGALIAFHLLLLLDAGRPPSGPWFVVLASPGIVLLVVGLLARLGARG